MPAMPPRRNALYDSYQGFYDQPLASRSSMLPFGTYQNPDGSESAGWAWPQMALDAVEAAEIPGRYLSGDPAQAVTPEDAQRTAINAAGLMMGGGLVAPKPAGALAANGGRIASKSDPKGITAFHGSPHDFDKFSLGKIGTGEGAQAYGHGLYFADDANVAKTYRGDSDPGATGYLYEARINANLEDFLDWDLPISQQSPLIRETLERLADHKFSHNRDVASGLTGKQAYGRIDRGQSDAAAPLREVGIPGIRYLDKGSRAAGEGSHNYVVFDDGLVDTIHKWRGDEQLFSAGSKGGAGVGMGIVEGQKPIRAYHGTRSPSDIQKFDADQSFNIGPHFGPLPTAELFSGSHPWQWAGPGNEHLIGSAGYFREAARSAKTREEAMRFAELADSAEMAAMPENGRILPVELNMKNPLAIDNFVEDMGIYAWDPSAIAETLATNGVRFSQDDMTLLRAADSQRPGPAYDEANATVFSSGKFGRNTPENAEANRLIRQRITEAGYDGLRYRDVDSGEGHSYIATLPGTVKSPLTGETLYSSGSPLGSGIGMTTQPDPYEEWFLRNMY